MLKSQADFSKEPTNPFLLGLEPSSREQLLSQSRYIQLDYKKEQLFFFGNSNIIIIESGVLMSIGNNQEDKQQGIDLLRPGDILGVVQLFNEENYDPLVVLPLTTVQGIVISETSFRRLIMENTDVAYALLEHYAKRYWRITERLYCQSRNSEERLRAALNLAGQLGLHRMTHNELALFTGLNRVTVTKLMHSYLKGGSPPPPPHNTGPTSICQTRRLNRSIQRFRGQFITNTASTSILGKLATREN